MDISPGDVGVGKLAVELNDSKLYSPTTSKLDAEVVNVTKPLAVPGMVVVQVKILHPGGLKVANSVRISPQVRNKASRAARKVVTLTNASWDT